VFGLVGCAGGQSGTESGFCPSGRRETADPDASLDTQIFTTDDDDGGVDDPDSATALADPHIDGTEHGPDQCVVEE
jgi:hypothetical protein